MDYCMREHPKYMNKILENKEIKSSENKSVMRVSIFLNPLTFIVKFNLNFSQNDFLQN